MDNKIIVLEEIVVININLNSNNKNSDNNNNNRTTDEVSVIIDHNKITDHIILGNKMSHPENNISNFNNL